jgi:hypothetical protein
MGMKMKFTVKITANLKKRKVVRAALSFATGIVILSLVMSGGGLTSTPQPHISFADARSVDS